MSQDAEYIELLNYAERNGIIDISRLKIDVEMSKREEYLKRHTYNIWRVRTATGIPTCMTRIPLPKERK